MVSGAPAPDVDALGRHHLDPPDAALQTQGAAAEGLDVGDPGEVDEQLAGAHPVAVAHLERRRCLGWRGVGGTAWAQVEEVHPVIVDVVTVGDCVRTEPLRALTDATREAVVNAAKHAGVGRVDVYAEVTPQAADVFVRDRGVGYDAAAVSADRHGVRHSILDRMARHGGRAQIRTAPGEGTEVRLHLPLEQRPTPDPGGLP